MAHIAIGWFSDNVQTGTFLAEYKGWIKMNENLLIMHHKTSEHASKS